MNRKRKRELFKYDQVKTINSSVGKEKEKSKTYPTADKQAKQLNKTIRRGTRKK